MNTVFLMCIVRGLQLVYRLFGSAFRVDVILYKVDKLGDWVLAEPAINEIIGHYVSIGKRVIVFSSVETTDYRKWHPLSVSVIEIPYTPSGSGMLSRGWGRLKRGARIIHVLARYRTDRFISMRYWSEPVSEKILRFVQAKERIRLSGDAVITSASDDRAPVILCGEIRRHFQLLKLLGINIEPETLLPKFDRPPAFLDNLLIAPFASAPIRDWGDSRWIELMGKIGGSFSDIHICVAPYQANRANILAGEMRKKTSVPIVVLIGDIPQMALAVARSRMVLCVDTFAAHMAAAYDVPTVCLIGGGHPGEFGPWRHSPRVQWLTNRLPCFGCGWDCSRSESECITKISTERVAAMVEQLLFEFPVETAVARDFK